MPRLCSPYLSPKLHFATVLGYNGTLTSNQLTLKSADLLGEVRECCRRFLAWVEEFLKPIGS